MITALPMQSGESKIINGHPLWQTICVKFLKPYRLIDSEFKPLSDGVDTRRVEMKYIFNHINPNEYINSFYAIMYI